jgi:hypothetical protein
MVAAALIHRVEGHADAYQGDAQYAVYVDGKQVGGMLTLKRCAVAASPIRSRSEVTGPAGNHTSQ